MNGERQIGSGGAAKMGAVAALGVRAPARLHLGFLDLGGALGRRFGSLGVTLEAPATQVTVARAAADAATGPDSARAARARDRIRAALGINAAFAVEVGSALRAHGGLGSGTQLAIAVGLAVARLSGHDLDPRAIAGLLGRGQRSAIGIEAFRAGGVILDGGKALAGPTTGDPPPLLARLALPEHWRILLLFDDAAHGLSGAEETRAIARLPEFPEALAAHLSHLLLLRGLPALVEGDALGFGAAVGEWQRALGDHYAVAQGGRRFLSPGVAEALAFIAQSGIPGVGQSSWGPTGFAIVGDAAQAQEMLQALRARFQSFTNLSFDCVRGSNRGAEILTLGDVPE